MFQELKFALKISSFWQLPATFCYNRFTVLSDLVIELEGKLDRPSVSIYLNQIMKS